MTDDRYFDTGEQPEADASVEVPAFVGHDVGNDNLHMAIPELAGAQTLANANVEGSPQARRRAKIMAWVLIGAFVLPIIGGLIAQALG